MDDAPVLRFPQWQEPLLHALMETNHETLTRKIEIAEACIGERLGELGPRPDNTEEFLALRDARSTLRVLRDVLAKSANTRT